MFLRILGMSSLIFCSSVSANWRTVYQTLHRSECKGMAWYRLGIGHCRAVGGEGGWNDLFPLESELYV
jgi:hypothetical protein